MADNPIENYPVNTTPVNTDIYAIVDDPTGTPATQQISHRNVQKVVLTKDDWIYAVDMIPTTTAGAAMADRELPTNDIQMRTMNFDAAADENVVFYWHPPETWDALTVDFALVWTNESGIAAEVIDFDLAGRSYADSDVLDQAPGTAQNVTDVWSAQNDYQKTGFSATPVTLAGVPANGQLAIFKLTFDNVASTLTGDCQVIAAIIRYGTVDNGST